MGVMMISQQHTQTYIKAEKALSQFSSGNQEKVKTKGVANYYIHIKDMIRH